MLKTYIKVLMALAGAAWAGMACAVGFGSASVSSALGQPLKVEISVVDIAGPERASMAARLASPDAFKAAGLDYPYHLSKLKFEIVTRNDQTYIEVTSKEPVNDSFVNLLVELNWSSGKLLREYTFLLDPPDYKPELPKAEEVQPIEPVVAPVQPSEAPTVAPLPSTAAASAPVTTVTPEAASAPVAASAVEAGVQPIPASAPAATAEEAGLAASAPSAPQPAPEASAAIKAPKPAPQTIKVKRGDTLTSIAAKVQQPDVTLEQMLVALYRANANQFDGRNMNRIRAGKILRVPGDDAFYHLSQEAAVKEIRIQTANWNAYRQKLAAYGTPVVEQPKQGASGKITTEVVDHTPVKKPSNGGTLQISRGEAPGAGGKAPAAQQTKEEAVAKEKAIKEDQQRIAQLEKQIQNMGKVQEMKKEGAVELKSGVQPPASTPAGAASAPAHVKPKPKMTPPPARPQPSFVDELLSPITESDLAKQYPMLQDPLVLGGGAGVVVLLLGGSVYAARRRTGGGGGRKKKLVSPEKAAPRESWWQRFGKKKKIDQRALIEHEAALEEEAAPAETAPEEEAAEEEFGAAKAEEGGHAPAPGVAIRTISPAKKQRPAAAVPEEIDALSEAELFLNFGRDAQAEEVLKEALASNPANIPVQLKLLTIYANRKDVNAFSSIARQVKNSGDAAAWEQAAILGYSIDPGNPMYAEAKGAAAAAAEMLSESGKRPATVPLDMDVGFNIPMDLDVTAATPAAQAAGMDFDVSVYDTAAPMDFDVTGSHPHVTEALLPHFDVTAGRPIVAETPAMDFDVTGGGLAAQPAGMDFDVTGSHPDVTATQHMDFDVTGSHPDVTATQHMDFDVTGSHPGVSAEAAADLGLPFDLGAPAAPASEASGGFGALSFDISAPLAAPAPEPGAAGGGLDFDISAAKPAESEGAGLGTLSFDIGSPPVPPSRAEEASPEPAGLDFDISGAEPEPGEAASAATSTVVLNAPMDFDLSAPPAGRPASEAQAAPGALDFDLNVASSVVIPPAEREASGLAGGMDFDLGETATLSNVSLGDEGAASLGGMDFDVSAPPPEAAKAEPPLDLGLAGISLDLGAPESAAAEAPAGGGGDVENKLELARAFQEMGDADTARELLGEVLKEGNARQVESAQQLIQKL